MDGIFVPNGTGYLPIDFRQKIQYNQLNQIKRIIRKTPLHWRRANRIYPKAQRSLSPNGVSGMGIISEAYKNPQGN
jgi:hypothetical protein